MRTLTIFGLLYSQHISNFASAIKRNSDYYLIGINNNPSLTQGEEYYERSLSSFDEIYDVRRFKSRILDFVSKTLHPFCLLAKTFRRSDVIQFNFISAFVLPLLIFNKLFGKAKTSSFVYGSDFLRVGRMRLYYLDLVFKFSDRVVCDSTTVLNGLQKRYPQYASKIKCCFFGSVIIDKLLEYDKSQYKPLVNTDKKVIMCGYNGIREQQHLKILSALRDVANRYYWIVPMTYGGSVSYRLEVINKLEEYGIEYKLLDSFLSEDEWINYIVNTDIFIHMQTTDAFSASLSEHLLLGHIVINAEWLRYDDFASNDVFYFSAIFESLSRVLHDAEENYVTYLSRLQQNRNEIVKIKGLQYCIVNYWLPYFEQLSIH